jgi:hypothetical protein
VGYGTLFRSRSAEEVEREQGRGSGGSFGGGEGAGEGLWTAFLNVWIAPRQEAVRMVVGRWWSRWGVLVVLPAAIVSA